MSATDVFGSAGPLRGRRRRALKLVVALGGIAFLAGGLLGTYHYLLGFWLYRGYPPPREPAFVDRVGKTLRLEIASPALGGRRQLVYVYLPPGYHDQALRTRRYPTLYLLHGFPGRPAAFLQTVRLAVVEDVLLARHAGKPIILVMPSGSTGTFTDKEWANGIGRHEQWETWVARDLVRAVDARFRTIPKARARGIGGLSEGGYGAINIALHHPGEFGLVESWSGYVEADNSKRIFGGDPLLLRHNTPLAVLPQVAASVRAQHTFFWFYSGRDDKLRFQNEAFARELAAAGVPHRFRLLHGGHNWRLWRGQAGRALMAASGHLRA